MHMLSRVVAARQVEGEKFALGRAYHQAGFSHAWFDSNAQEFNATALNTSAFYVLRGNTDATGALVSACN